jgi:hypothetical protein
VRVEQQARRFLSLHRASLRGGAGRTHR